MNLDALKRECLQLFIHMPYNEQPIVAVNKVIDHLQSHGLLTPPDAAETLALRVFEDACNREPDNLLKQGMTAALQTIRARLCAKIEVGDKRVLIKDLVGLLKIIKNYKHTGGNVVIKIDGLLRKHSSAIQNAIKAVPDPAFTCDDKKVVE